MAKQQLTGIQQSDYKDSDIKGRIIVTVTQNDAASWDNDNIVGEAEYTPLTGWIVGDKEFESREAAVAYILRVQPFPFR